MSTTAPGRLANSTITPYTTAVAAYYRSLFLNLTLPGGVVGDVHRGFGHGLRAVAWERSAGQVVQIALTVAVLLVVPSPVQAVVPLAAVVLVVAAAGSAPTPAPSWATRWGRPR